MIAQQMTIRAYQYLLSELEQTSRNLCSAIESWDADEVHRLINIRAGLIKSIGPSAKNVQAAISQIKSDEDRQAVVDDLESRQETVIFLQTECESALSKGLSQLRGDLINFNKRRELRSVYNSAPVVESARFIDSKR